MNIIDDMLDWAADKVQTFTGEKERRQLVQEYKDTYIQFKNSVEHLIEIVNDKIREFNEQILLLNDLRKEKVKNNINSLWAFLSKFGPVKEAGEYAKEEESLTMALPTKEFEEKEAYITEIDWSKEDVFINTFFTSPIGMKIKTRKQNLSIKEELGEFHLLIEETLNQLQLKTERVEMDSEIAEIYIFCIKTIAEYIVRVILPELEVVEAFFQALKIKNEIVSGNKLEEISFSTDLTLLKDTVYNKHFLFVKNVFMFYILSCKIYDTPVLTKLLKGESDEIDKITLISNKQALLEMKDRIDGNLIFKRG